MIDYATLHEARPQGRCVGSYVGCPIREAVVDRDGQRYVYAGLAPRCRDGSLDIDALEPGEFLVPPGLVYRLEAIPAPWWHRLFC